MLLRILLIGLSLLLLSGQKVCAQLAPADDFFNSGAQLYISNNIPAALARTEAGLKLYPNDVKLKKLEELLKQQQKQQQQNQQQQNQSQQQQSQNKQQSQQKQNSQNRQNQQQQQKQSAQQQQAESQNKSEQNKNQEQQAAAKGQAMTPEQAKQLLDEQKSNERILQFKPPQQPENPNQPIKDW